MYRSVIVAVAVVMAFLPAAGEVVRLSLDGTVNPATSAYVVRGLAEANRVGASLVVLVLDTPGGLDTAMKEIMEAILASHVPVVVWVGPAGALAALRAQLDALDVWGLTAAQSACAATGSLVLALALVKGRIDPAGAFAASQLDEDYQIEQWGEDYEAADRRALLKADLEQAERLLALVRSA